MWCYLPFLSLVYLFTVVFLIFLGPALTQRVILAQAIEFKNQEAIVLMCVNSLLR